MRHAAVRAPQRAGTPKSRHNRGMARLELIINGTRRQIDADAERTLLSVLRDGFDLTGAKFGCGEGQCGACTVLVDDLPTRSCRTAAASVAGKNIITIEGLEQNGRLHPVQQAFLDTDAMQCGYCTPGMIMGAVALLKKNPKPTDAEIVRGMNGHICRCGTYVRIVQAVRDAAKKAGRA